MKRYLISTHETRAERIPTHTVMIAMPYSHYERVRLLAEAHRGIMREEEFSGEVTLTCEFAVAGLPAFQDALSWAFGRDYISNPCGQRRASRTC